MSKTF